MRTSLLELLECPLCHLEVAFSSATMDGDRVRFGDISCRNEHRFPIREYVPIFADNERYVEAFSTLERTQGSTEPSGAGAPSSTCGR